MIWAILWLAAAYFAFIAIYLDEHIGPDTIAGYFWCTLFYVFVMMANTLACGGAAYGVGALYAQHPVKERYTSSQRSVIRTESAVNSSWAAASSTVKCTTSTTAGSRTAAYALVVS